MILSDKCYLKDNCKKYNINCNNNIFCMKLFKINELYDKTLLSLNQRKTIKLFPDEDGTDNKEFKELKIIQENIEDNIKNGINIYIHSSTCGNGKTSWSIKMIQSYINSIWYKANLECKALFINVPRYLLALKDNISEKNEYVEHIKANILNADLVVWDDIATKNVTEYEAENLLSVIDTRINNGKANIFTSNMSENEIEKLMGKRLASRIINCSYNFELKGQDKRMLKKYEVK